MLLLQTRISNEWRWRELPCCGFLRWQLLRFYGVGDRWMSKYRTLVKLYWQWKKVLTEESVLMPQFPPRILNGMLWCGSRDSAVECRQQTTWTMAKKLPETETEIWQWEASINPLIGSSVPRFRKIFLLKHPMALHQLRESIPVKPILSSAESCGSARNRLGNNSY